MAFSTRCRCGGTSRCLTEDCLDHPLSRLRLVACPPHPTAGDRGRMHSGYLDPGRSPDAPLHSSLPGPGSCRPRRIRFRLRPTESSPHLAGRSRVGYRSHPREGCDCGRPRRRDGLSEPRDPRSARGAASWHRYPVDARQGRTIPSGRRQGASDAIEGVPTRVVVRACGPYAAGRRLCRWARPRATTWNARPVRWAVSW
jgi:hypothetical protein